MNNIPYISVAKLISPKGLTETATTICSLRYDRKLGSVGGAGEIVPGIVAKVVKADGSLAAEGEEGELVVKGPNTAMGYFENPSAYVCFLVSVATGFSNHSRTAETFVDGWVRTGDEVVIRNLEVFVVDRLKVSKIHSFPKLRSQL